MATRFTAAGVVTGRCRLAWVCVGLLSALTACQKAAETTGAASGGQETIERAPDQSPARDRGDSHLPIEPGEARPGSTAAKNATRPEDFPADVFLPDHAATTGATDMAGLRLVNMTSDASAVDLSAAIQANMEAQGWKREMTMQAAAGRATLVFSKDKRQSIYQMMQDEAGGTQVVIRTGGDD